LKAEVSQKRKTKPREGVVVRKSGNKSVLVEVTRRIIHPKYKKIVIRKKCFMIHDEENEAKVGDRVTFIESKPISRRKRWKLLAVVKGKGA
jgi:small subunit ribosomal protein S17